MRKIEVCLSPELLHLYDLRGITVVVVDILRATSCMTTALANGVTEIVPVSELSECKKLKDNGYFKTTRQTQNTQWLDDIIIDRLKSEFYSNQEIKKAISKIKSDITAGKLSPKKAASTLIESYLKKII